MLHYFVLRPSVWECGSFKCNDAIFTLSLYAAAVTVNNCQHVNISHEFCKLCHIDLLFLS